MRRCFRSSVAVVYFIWYQIFRGCIAHGCSCCADHMSEAVYIFCLYVDSNQVMYTVDKLSTFPYHRYWSFRAFMHKYTPRTPACDVRSTHINLFCLLKTEGYIILNANGRSIVQCTTSNDTRSLVHVAPNVSQQYNSIDRMGTYLHRYYR